MSKWGKRDAHKPFENLICKSMSLTSWIYKMETLLNKVLVVLTKDAYTHSTVPLNLNSNVTCLSINILSLVSIHSGIQYKSNQAFI